MSRAAFRFVVVDHPEQLRDKQEMRENRMHVMHDYLDKKGQRPMSRDSRINASIRPKRKRPSRTPSATATSLQGASYATNGSQRVGSGSTSPESVQDESNSEKEHVENAAKASTESPSDSAEPRKAVKRVYQPPTHGKSLVSGIGGRFDHSAYMKTMLEDVPAGPGANLEPFGTWPSLISPSLDVNALKWSCSQRFGSDSLATHWIPTLLRARHAFLSTLCISSSHDAIMTRALVPSHVQSSYKNIQRWRIKRDVISLVAACMSDPERQAADETIVAVLHLLNSDIMGCDDRDLNIHQVGLIKMVRQRGGLEQLGVGGELAGVLTITNYLIAALREMIPHNDYVRFASKQNTNVPDGTQPLPESPVYSRVDGFHNVQSALSHGSEAYVILDLVRILTNRFFLKYGEQGSRPRPRPRPQNGTASPVESPLESIAELCQMIFAFAPATDKEFNDMNERYTYESVRLTARIYAFALANNLPFSKAAASLSKQERSLHPKAEENKRDQDKTLAIQLKHALMRTDISFCWDHLGGVLFWITLVGGAAANPGPFAEEERVGEPEDARKFLAALAVRCAIVLSFQYGFAVLETLKKMVAIEAALSSEKHAGDAGETFSASGADTTEVYGPLEPSHLQKGFADFALDFATM